MRTLLKDIFRNIKNSKGRFISLFLIVTLAVAFCTGIGSTSSDMKITADVFYDDSKLMDLKVMSTLGITDDDISALKNVDGVEHAGGGYTQDALTQIDEQQCVVSVKSITEDVNEIVLAEGSMPAEENECLLDENYLELYGFTLGDSITLFSGNESDLSETLSYTTLKIVGTFYSSEYISFDYGSSSIGSGSVDAIVFVMPETFILDYYTEADILVKDAGELLCYSDEYDDLIDGVSDNIEEIETERCDARYGEITEEAQAEIDDAKEEIAENEADLTQAKADLEEAKQQVSDGEREIEEAKQELLDAQKQAEDGQSQIEEAKAQLEDAKAEVTDGRAQLESAKAELSASEAEVLEGQTQLESAKAELAASEAEVSESEEAVSSGEAELGQAKQTLQQSRAEYEAGTAEYEGSLAAYEAAYAAQLEAATASAKATYGDAYNEQIQAQVTAQVDEAFKETKDTLSQAKSRLDEANEELSAADAEIAEKEAQLSAAKEQIKSAKAQLSAADVEIAEKEAQLSSAREQIAAGYAQIEASEAELSAAEEEIANGYAEIEANQASVDSANKEIEEGYAELEKSEQELSDGKKEIEDGEAEIADGEEKIADAKKEVEDAQAELDSVEYPEWYVLDRSYATVDYADFESDSDKLGNIAKVFPVLFFIVAALVCLTTMTRMVEEERTLIGTFKALGYSKGWITGKYIIYALIATLLGIIVGALSGGKIFPNIIIYVYKLVYRNLLGIQSPYNITIILVAAAAALGSILAATLFAVVKSLSESAADLMRPVSPKRGKKLLLERITPLWRKIPFNWKNALRNFTRYKKRLFMTMFGIAGSTALLLVGFGIKDSVNSIVYLQYGEICEYKEIITIDSGATEAQLNELYGALDSDPRFSEYINIYQTSLDASAGVGAETMSMYLMVVEDEEKINDFMNFRERIGGKAHEITDSGVVITEKMAAELGLSEGDTIYFSKDAADYRQAQVTGVVENYLYHYAFMSKALYEELYGTLPDYNAVLINNAEGAEVDPDEFGEEFLKHEAVGGISCVDALIEDVNEMLSSMTIITLILIVCAGALTFIVLFNLNNINISERRRELATLKVLGFYDGELTSYIVRENILITILSVAIGIFGGYFLTSYVITTVEVDMVMFGRELHTASYIWSIALAVGFAAVVNWIVHFKLKKIDMATSLKSVE